ncbi:hypothetical protein I601_1193 [Nocardioides dokdonensis FR1436]|uniref:Leucine-binding protein domain-containing protein n=1 Tax=Nocardioides dokdonensis FR1436 TaxID=1300347 RepID=A0A1A9GJJ0_9ACTN|nr:ABC transporter substrate-binding protein [Nocardioides dokdonensis]ANH37635.1 hypothetical protein I601_1193 [Nocardioides dokdonensis FR1436]
MTTFRKTGVLIAAGAAASLVTACGGAAIETGSNGEVPGVTDDTITIGILPDLTGPVAAIGEPLARGAQAYVDHLNENGGIDGRQVELVVKDTQFNPQRAVQEYRKIEDDVLGIVTTVGEGITAAVVPEMDKDNVFSWPGTYSQSYLESEHPPISTPYIYEALGGIDYMVSDLDAAGKTLSNFNLESGINEDYSRAVEIGAEVYGVEAGSSIAKPSTETDYTGAVQTLSGGDPDFMLVGTAPAQAASFIGTGYSQGLRVPTMISSVGYSPTVLATKTGSVLKEVAYVTSPWAAWNSDEQGQQELVEAFGPDEEPDVQIQVGWVMAKGLTDLIAMAAEEGDLTREGIKDALSTATLDFGGIAPSVDFTREDGVYGTTKETRIYKVTDNGLELVKDLFVAEAADEVDAP